MASIFTQKFRLPFFFLFFFNDPNISSTIHESNRLFCQKTEDHFIIKGSYKFFLYDFFSFFFLCLDRTLESVKKRGRGKNYPFISAYFILSKEILGRRRAKNRSSLRRRERFSRKERYSFLSANPLIFLSFSLVRKFFFNRSDCDSSTFFVFCLAKWMRELTKRRRRNANERYSI